MTIARALFQLLVFPGLLYAAPASWLMVWLERKTAARLQNRLGPPFLQPFFDFVKLLAKRSLPRSGGQGFVLTALPVLAVASTLGALALLPVVPAVAGFSGDLVLLVALLELPPLFGVLAGFATRSLYGELGATREAVLSVAYSLPFLAALIALATATGSLSLSVLAETPVWAVRAPALLALALCLPVKLRVNPFSVANAEQEIYTGATTEYEGPRLALWELAHGLEWVVLTGLWATMAFPVAAAWPVHMAAFVVISIALVLVVATVAAATARLKLAQATRVYLSWGLGISALALVIAMVLPS
ncbi:MAG TPA: NADH-quinone oxidoreductase subunit H [Thermoleophilia bacterium]|nr:NADH-quinone oxidoreductase subunit H [Thermoleophilia bacterium]